MNGDNRDNILKNINAALKSKKLYPPGHPSIAAPVNKALTLLLDELKTRNNLAVALVNEALIYEEDIVPDAEKLYVDILQQMADKNVDAIIFEKGVSLKELSTLFDILSGPTIQGAELQGEMHSKDVTHVTLKSVPIGKKNILEIYNGAVEVVKDVMTEIRMGKIPKSEPVNNIVNEMTESVLSDPNAIIGLTMI